MLLDHGADDDGVEEDGHTPLHLAAVGGHSDIAMVRETSVVLCGNNTFDRFLSIVGPTSMPLILHEERHCT